MSLLARTRPSFAALFGVALVVSAILRFAWPLADPPEGMSWSSGSYTDPPSNVLAARYAVQGSPAGATFGLAPLLYPALQGLARAAYELMGPRRIATVVLAALLGVGQVALLALALRRGSGNRAALCGAFLAATSSWLVPNARILMPEGVAVLLLLGATYLAMSRGLVAAAAAGAVATIGGLFGKYHALAFLPALWIFLHLRSGRRAALASLGGAVGAAGLWFVTIFAPHHAEILSWIRSFFTEGPGGVNPKIWLPGLWLTPFSGLQQSWLAPLMPVVLAIAAWFVVETLALSDLRRRRVEDGSALFVLWVVASFFATSLLPYRAPRYFTLVAAPLVACAACQIGALLGAGAEPARRRLEGFALFVWCWAAAFAAQDGLGRIEAEITRRFFLEEWVRDPNAPATFSRLYGAMGSLTRQVVLSAVASALMVAALSWRNRAAQKAPMHARRVGAALLALALAWDVTSWGAWALQRTTTIEDAKRALGTVVAPGAVILGGLAPLLTEGSSFVAIPRFGAFRASVLTDEPRPTHLLLVASDFADVAEVDSSLANRLEPVTRWPIRTLWAKAVVLYRLPSPELPATYQLCVFEQATVATDAGDAARALTLAAEHRAALGETSDLVLLEATCQATDGDLKEAERLFQRAAELRPLDPLPLRSLGALALAADDTGAARAYYMRAIALDPMDPTIPAFVWEFLEQ